VLHGSLLVEVALKHSDILCEITLVELHEIVEVCNFMRSCFKPRASICTVPVCEAVKDVTTDVELKENKMVLASQWQFFGVTILHYIVSDMAVNAVWCKCSNIGLFPYMEQRLVKV
jgi:hypothetical protein